MWSPVRLDGLAQRQNTLLLKRYAGLKPLYLRSSRAGGTRTHDPGIMSPLL